MIKVFTETLNALMKLDSLFASICSAYGLKHIFFIVYMSCLFYFVVINIK